MIDLDDVPRIARGPGSPAQPIATLGVLGDIHAEDERLATAIDWLERSGVDRIVHVGDVCDGRGSLDRTLSLLEAHRIVGIAGNHERWFMAREMRHLRNAQPVEALTDAVAQTLRTWPPLLELSSVVGPLLICHGVGDDDETVLRPDTLATLAGTPALDRLLSASRFRVVVAGHTHEPAVHVVGPLAWINAGTLKYDDAPVVTRIDLRAMEVAFGALDDPSQVGEVRRVALPPVAPPL